MQNVRVDDAQARIKIAGRNINNLRYADDTTIMAENKKELKSLLMKMKEESESTGLNLNIQKTKIMASGPITSWQIDGETTETVRGFILLGFKTTADGDSSHETNRCLLLERKAMTNLYIISKSRDIRKNKKLFKKKKKKKKQRHYFANKGLTSQVYGFSSSHVWMWELDHKESWALKNWCFSTVVLEKTLESPVDCKEIKPVNPKGNQSWIFIGRTDAEAEAEAPILWPPDAKSWLIKKDPDAGKNWRQEEKGTTEDEMVGWHHRLNRYEFEQAPGNDDGQGSQESQRVRHNWATKQQQHKTREEAYLCIFPKKEPVKKQFFLANQDCNL